MCTAKNRPYNAINIIVFLSSITLWKYFVNAVSVLCSIAEGV